MRVAVRVRPGASRTAVGGRWGADALVVAVTERAVGGAATRAVCTAVAEALGVRRSAVTVVSGHTARSKLLHVDDPPPGTAERLHRLLDG